MSSRAFQPTAEEIRAVAEILRRVNWPGARKALKPHFAGTQPWVSALRAVKKLIREIGDDPRGASRIPIRDLAALRMFAVTFGDTTRVPVGVEPLTVVKTVRWGETEWANLEAAAEAAGVKPTELIRGLVAKGLQEAA